MPIVPRVGRKSLKLRAALGLMYALLVLGGLSMVWPFAITLTQSVSNKFECARHDAFPRYLLDPFERYLKYLAEKYDEPEDLPLFRAAYHAPPHWGSFRDLAFDPAGARRVLTVFGGETNNWASLKAQHDDYAEFLETYDPANCKALFFRLNLSLYQRFLLDRYGARMLRASGRAREDLSRRAYEAETLALMGRERGTSYASIHAVNLIGRRVAFDLQLMLPAGDVVNRDTWDFMRTRPPAERIPYTRHLLWSAFLLRNNVDPARLAWPPGCGPCATVYDIPFHLPDGAPAEIVALKARFLREGWPVRLVRIEAAEEPAFRAFIRARFPSLEAFNQAAGTAYARWEDVPFHREAPRAVSLAEQTQWRDFVLQLPRGRWTLLAPETAYQQFLLGKYGSVRAIEARHGRAIPDLRELRLPIAESDYVHYRLNRGRFLREFLTRNYVTVIEYLALRGRAFGNTVVLIALSMLAALTINPLAAYALSRFRPRYTYQLLLFFLATMAFPPMVAAIPSFLLLRDLGMLNTYSALILPTVANGYSIFLLKGFFDSLPQELYEAASIEGAGELRMFLVISLPLVKPILAVIALNTFIASYGGFMWALIVCQKEEMWTLSVWMFQFYQRFGGEMPYLATAGMMLISLPTLLVFVFCQKMILRGIVIPTMK